MRFAGAVIADDQQALVVCGLFELQLRNDYAGEFFGHLVGDDVCFNELLRCCRLVGIAELDHRLDGFEFD